jgi:anaerobic magnesium-protoporphyrin IX monomethyl ester cyclase
MIKARADIPIIFGGIHPTCVPEYVILEDSVDMVCVGEGEYAMLELVQSMQSGQADHSIKNIWFKKGAEVIRNSLRPLVSDLDQLPFADKELYYAASSHFKNLDMIMTGRGCPSSCSYCCNASLKRLYHNNGTYVRRRSVSNVIQELLTLKDRKDIKNIWFADDIFISNKAWLTEFLAEYKRSVRIPFSCYVHYTYIDEATVVLLKSSGCLEVEMGIQTWSEDVRREVLYRTGTNEQIERAIDVINTYGLRLATDTILGVPGQTEDELCQLLNFSNKKRISVTQALFLRYYPKAPIIEIAKAMGVIRDEEIYAREYGLVKPVPICRGGDVINKRLLQLRAMFCILPFLPRWLNSFLVKRRIYRHFPTVPILAIKLLSGFSGNVSAIGKTLRSMLIRKYFIFIAKRAILSLKVRSA